MSKTLRLRKSTPVKSKRLLTGSQLRRRKGRGDSPLPKDRDDPAHPLMGKLVSFGDGHRGRMIDSRDGQHIVKLAIPDRTGVLLVTDSECVVDGEIKALSEDVPSKECKARAFQNIIGFEASEKMVTVRDKDNHVMDYRDVIVSGLASTFKDVTPEDRDGDYVQPYAFDKTLQDFQRNPVMLTDHRNSVDALAGSFTKIGKVTGGLAVEGKLSNAPDVQSVRFKVAEGHLKAFSIGGLFLYGRDGYAIEEVVLFEVSLVPVPANQDALFSTRSLTLDDCSKAFRHFKEKVWS